MAFFTVLDRGRPFPKQARDQAYLVADNWDDWGEFGTTFHLTLFDGEGNAIYLGETKIGVVGLKPAGRGVNRREGWRSPTLPKTFESLDEEFFSLGQDENYYETLNTLPQFRLRVLKGLRDCAYDLTLFARFESEMVMRRSLLRFVAAEQVRNRLHRLALGNAKLTRFDFQFVVDSREQLHEPLALRFTVEPESNPPTNVHVLIGRNGVGKSRTLQGMIRALLEEEAESNSAVRFVAIESQEPDPESTWRFAGFVFVSFSAFDTFVLPPVESTILKMNIVGLHPERGSAGPLATKSRHELNQEFIESFARCRAEPRATRLRDAISVLESDSLFAEAEVATFLNSESNAWREELTNLFGELSSGHAIVLLTVTRLVELVDERTVVFIDEPEGHLHPPLLSAFVRALSDLLTKRNGVAIIATHSPVVLQEVPRSCVWKIWRHGGVVNAERPSLETFGENVGVLTRDVFRLEVSKAGFHRLIEQAVDRGLSYDQVLSSFDGQLGAEARAIARTLVSLRDSVLK